MDSLLAEPALQRAQGEIGLTVRRRDTRTVLARLRQSGCLKARLPKVAPDAFTEAVLLNSSGGIASGDTLTVKIAAAPRSQLTVTGQAAERYYRAPAGHAPALLRTHLQIDSGATIEWLPQESILFDGCALDRRLTVDLTADATFLGVEMLVFGREASGERIAQAMVRDVIHIRRDGIPLAHEAIQLDGPVADLLDRSAIAKRNHTIATLIYAAPDAEAMLETVREALNALANHAEAGASAWNNLLMARFCMPDSRTLRAAVLAALDVLRHRRAMPRLWRL